MTDPLPVAIFETRSITADGTYRLKPKDFPRNMTRCVMRKQQVEEILKKLETAAEDESIPGVYLAGPAGAGKSILAYTIAQICKFERNWLTIYIPDCRSWVDENPVKGKGFFLDHVLDALSTKEMQDQFTQIYEELNSPQTLKLGFKPPAGETWTYVATEQSKKVDALYYMVTASLVNSEVNVLLVCDEINALWGTHQSYEKEPWNLTRFQPSFLRNGAMLLSGTTDNDFVGNIPNGLEKHVYEVGKFSDPEIEGMMRLDAYEALGRIADFDADTWRSIADASGNIPRELRLYVDGAAKFEFSKRIKDFSESTDEPVKKRMRMKTDIQKDVDKSIHDWRVANVRRHAAMLNHVLRSKTENATVFTKALFKACEFIFLQGRPAPTVDEVLRVPNFVVTTQGMYPTTVDAQKVYYEWFCEQESNGGVIHMTKLFQRFLSASSGGDRGNAFEDYLSAKLTVLGRMPDAKFAFRRLNATGKMFFEVPMQVKERAFTSTDSPPKNFQHFADDTLLTHVDLNGGEARVDLIHYRKDRVLYIEATVGSYRDTKIPTLDDTQGRQQLILQTLRKWLGETVFKVEVVTPAGQGQQLATSQKELSVTYRAKSNKNRPPVPEIHYIVATTCPLQHRPTPSRINKYNWIKVCFLEDLISANIVPSEYKEDILSKQAQAAGCKVFNEEK